MATDGLQPLRVGMVGAGFFAPFQLEGWRDAGQQVKAICDIDLARARALAGRFGVEAVYASVEEMLDSAHVDVIDVCLPPAAQAAVLRTLLPRGTPTICQKPFGQNLGEAQALAALAASHGTTFVIHENFRFSPWYREARRLIDSGVLGDLHALAFRLRPGDGQGPRAYLDRQPYFQKMPRLLIRETGMHFIDTFRYLMGEVEAVTARLRRVNPVISGEDAGLVIFEFAGGSSGLFDGNRLNDHLADNPRRTMGEMWLEGSAGVLRLDGDARLWWRPHHGGEAEHVYPRPFEGVFGGACAALQSHVVAHLQQGTLLENAAHDYLTNLRIEEAIYASHESGRRIRLADFTSSSLTS